MDTVRLDKIIEEVLNEYLIFSSNKYFQMDKILQKYGLEPLSPERAYVRLRIAKGLTRRPELYHDEKYMPHLSIIDRSYL